MIGRIACVAAGGAIGALLRYGASSLAVCWLGKGFPWGTLAVNLTGSFAFGLLLSFARAGRIPEPWQMLLFTGLLGAFTTFSTFSIETVQLLHDHKTTLAGINLVGSCAAGVSLAAAGMFLGRVLAPMAR